MKRKRPSREQLLELAKKDPETLVDLVLMLWDRVEALEAEVAELKKNSRNSSRPPSSDRNSTNKPPTKTRKDSKSRKQGGQPGHDGHTLRKSDCPDKVIRHELPGECDGCGASLRGVKAGEYESRQSFDIPESINMEVTEHRAEVGTCSCCQKKVKGVFPEEVKAPVQYGERIKAMVIYLQTYQLLPCERLSELCRDVFSCPMSAATVANFLRRAGARAGPVVEKIKKKIREAPYIHADETGLSLFGKIHWLHTASTPELTYLHIDEKRGRPALEAMAMLDGYTGWVIHDFFSSYYHFETCRHALCNAHHLRDLTYVQENLGQEWGGDMIDLLLEAKRCKQRELSRGRRAGKKTLERLQNRYLEILEEGYSINSEPVRRKGQRGRLKRGKALNLLDRFCERQEEVMAFVIHDLPFDNNQAERDLRMMKTKQKISGCFRSYRHATAFAGLRSIIATARKKSIDILEVIRATLSDTHRAVRLLNVT